MARGDRRIADAACELVAAEMDYDDLVKVGYRRTRAQFDAITTAWERLVAARKDLRRIVLESRKDFAQCQDGSTSS